MQCIAAYFYWCSTEYVIIFRQMAIDDSSKNQILV